MLVQFVLSLTFATFASLDQVEMLIDEYSVCQKCIVFYGFKQMTQAKTKCCMNGKTILKIVHKYLIINTLKESKQ